MDFEKETIYVQKIILLTIIWYKTIGTHENTSFYQFILFW